MAGEFQINKTTPEECINSLKIIERHVLSNHRQGLLYACQKGEVLKSLKILTKRKRISFQNFLLSNDLKYSRSYVNFFIKLSDFASEHNDFLHVSLSIHFLYQNWKYIPTLFLKMLANSNE